jgi:hypothetical protein
VVVRTHATRMAGGAPQLAAVELDFEIVFRSLVHVPGEPPPGAPDYWVAVPRGLHPLRSNSRPRLPALGGGRLPSRRKHAWPS